MLSELSSSSSKTQESKKSTRLSQQQEQYYHTQSVNRRRSKEQEEDGTIRPRSRRRINKERIEHDMNLVYTCSRQVSESLTSNAHDQLTHIDSLIDTTKRMLQTLGDAREQWLEQQSIKISTTNKTTSISSKTSPKSNSTIQTITTLNNPSSPSPPAPTSKTIISQPSRRSREQSIDTPKQCHSCQSTDTPEWRKGPMGPRTLCNACGLIWAKLARQQGIPEGPDEEPTTNNVNENHEGNKNMNQHMEINITLK